MLIKFLIVVLFLACPFFCTAYIAHYKSVLYCTVTPVAVTILLWSRSCPNPMYFCPYNSILLIKHQYNKLWCNEIRDIANYFQIPSVASTTLQITGYNEITDTMNAVRVLVDYVTSRFYSTAEAEAG